MDIKLANASLAYAKTLANAKTAGEMDGAESLGGAKAAGPSFSELVKEAGTDAIQRGEAAEQVSMASLTKDAGVADIVTAVSNAEIALDTVVTVRDKVVQAYQEIIRMPI